MESVKSKDAYESPTMTMKQKQKEAADGTVSAQGSGRPNEFYSPYTPPSKEGF